MIGLTRVRCLTCGAGVEAEVQRAGRPPQMLHHSGPDGARCAAASCEPEGAAAARARQERTARQPAPLGPGWAGQYALP